MINLGTLERALSMKNSPCLSLTMMRLVFEHDQITCLHHYWNCVNSSLPSRAELRPRLKLSETEPSKSELGLICGEDQ
jgi:hypothetical protein